MERQADVRPAHASEGSAASGERDAETLRRAQAGDATAFQELVDRFSGELYRLALFLTGQASDADDVLQETFLGAYQNMAAFEGRASVKTWLSRILVNQAARHHRAQRVRKAAHPVHLSAASSELLEGAARQSPERNSDIRMDVLTVLDSLRPDARAIVVLRELEGLSYRQIAEVLAVPEGTVESRLFRARQELKERLGAYLE